MKHPVGRSFLGCGILLVLLAPAANAQTQVVKPPPYGIVDNSFLIEEAFNQDPGVFQNILTFDRHSRDWAAAFTQEWPAPNMRHQFSYSLPFARVEGGEGMGDVMLNYRFQALEEASGLPAFAPRLTVILPSGRPDEGLGDGVAAWQIGLPFSKRAGRMYFHWNLGLTYHRPHDHADSLLKTERGTDRMLGGSSVWRLSPTLNLLFEALLESNAVRTPGSSGGRETEVTLSPGFRKAWNLADQQVVIGLAIPFTRTSAGTRATLFTYLSYELPFKR